MNSLMARPHRFFPALILLGPWAAPPVGTPQDAVRLVYRVPANERVEVFLRQRQVSTTETPPASNNGDEKTTTTILRELHWTSAGELLYRFQRDS
ncbi:MAG: hypothetical protein ACJA2W_001750 [Planctomycetota bacterium]|jgi:hypothetical protein